MKIIRKISGIYNTYPIFFDLSISIGIWCAYSLDYDIFNSIEPKRENLLAVFAYVVSSAISLVGFILTALTVIISFKSNISAKEEKSNFINLIFTTKYNEIVRIFKISIIELFCCFVFSKIIWIFSDSFSDLFLFKSLLILVFLLITSTLRGIYLLFSLI